jgi:hypothetical protein
MNTFRRRPRTWGVLAAAAVATLVVARPDPAPAPAADPPSPLSLPAVVGSAGCTTAGCHGGPVPAAGVHSPSAATHWFDHDPHARAYDALLGTAGRKIAAALGSGPAEFDPRCLACHAHPAAVADDPRRPGAVAFRREGVGCESCHGAAGVWLGPHTAAGPDRYAAPGMTRLNNPSVRAGVCAGCHVGAPAGGGSPLRDVTHEMIAAGHPRLAFELASACDALPRHWAEPTDRAARLWVAGQAWAAAHALRLAAAHPTEFARLDCAACHHALGDAGYPRRGPGGRPAVDRWNVSDLLRAAVADDPPARAALAPGADRSEAAEALAGWAEGVERGGRAEAVLKAALAGAAPAGNAPAWDAAAQYFLALRAYRQARGDRPDPEADAGFAAVRGRLQIRPGFQSPSGSPPDVALGGRLAALFRRLER